MVRFPGAGSLFQAISATHPRLAQVLLFLSHRGDRMGFTSLLAADRGEIAIRIIRAAAGLALP